jgi:hypothetical protein
VAHQPKHPAGRSAVFMRCLLKIRQIVELIEKNENSEAFFAIEGLICCIRATKRPFIHGSSLKSRLALVQ